MAEKDLVIKEKLEHSGIFDFKGLYGYAHSWLKEEGYGVTEDKYSESVTGNTRFIQVEWSISKKVSDYFKFEVSVKYEISGLTDVEVEIDGQRKKMNKGKVSIDFKGTLVTDHESKWESSPTNRFLRDVYNKFIIPSRISNMKDRLSGDVRSLKEDIKEFLDLTGKR